MDDRHGMVILRAGECLAEQSRSWQLSFAISSHLSMLFWGFGLLLWEPGTPLQPLPRARWGRGDAGGRYLHISWWRFFIRAEYAQHGPHE